MPTSICTQSVPWHHATPSRRMRGMREYIQFHKFPIAGINPMTAATSRSFPRHIHDQYGVGVVDAGGHSSWSGRGQVEAGPRSFICVNPGEVHDGHAVGEQSRRWRMFYFDPSIIEQARCDILDGNHAQFTFRAPVFADARLHPLFEAMFAHGSSAESDDGMAVETSLLTFVAALAGHSTANSTPGAKTADIRRARERIDDDPSAPLSLADLARDSGVSRYRFLRTFARELGLTPHAYIMQRRLSRARRLILAGRPLIDIASACGFFDQSHLNRCFVRQFGVTPRRYREKLS
jgi:AraC-like DNA-binding protein